MEKENLSFYTLSSKELIKKSGIYKLSAGGHIYIGSSKSLYARLMEHRHDLENNNHANDFLQKVCNKYGINNIRVDIIEFCDPKDRIVREKYWMDYLKADMNMKDPVTNKLSEASRIKLGNSVKKGRANGKYKTKYDFSKIECYDIFGKYITTYDSLNDAEIKTGISRKSLLRALNAYKKGGIASGLRFRYVESNVPVQEFHFNPIYVGKYFNFNYIDEDGNEQFAFNDCRDVWKFLGEMINNKNPKQIILIPKLKNLVNLGNPRKKKGNPNPSI